MGVLLGLGIFYTGYGIAGVLGFQIISERYKNHVWTANYIRYRGISWLMIGIPWLLLYHLTNSMDIDRSVMCLLVLACGTPATVYSFAQERKYRQMLHHQDCQPSSLG